MNFIEAIELLKTKHIKAINRRFDNRKDFTFECKEELSLKDILATDWQCKDPQLLSFADIISDYRYGSRIARAVNINKVYDVRSDENNAFSKEDILSHDWLIIEKGEKNE